MAFRLSEPKALHLITFTNTTTNRTKGVDTGDGIVYPDIVVVDQRNFVMLLGEVETYLGITRNEALQWAEYAGLCSGFYLYVPEGYEETVVDYLDENDTPLSGLRTIIFKILSW